MLVEPGSANLSGNCKCSARMQTDISDIYSLAAKTTGVFVNIALQEPFGLTLIEAAVHGAPIVATKHGGPVDIVKTLKACLLPLLHACSYCLLPPTNGELLVPFCLAELFVPVCMRLRVRHRTSNVSCRVPPLVTRPHACRMA